MNSKIFCKKNRTHSVHVCTLHQTKIWMWASNVHICNIAFTHTFRILFLCRPQTHPPPLYRSSVYSFTLVPMKTVTILAGCSATCRCQSIVQCAWAFEESPLDRYLAKIHIRIDWFLLILLLDSLWITIATRLWGSFEASMEFHFA